MAVNVAVVCWCMVGGGGCRLSENIDNQQGGPLRDTLAATLLAFSADHQQYFPQGQYSTHSAYATKVRTGHDITFANSR